METFVKKDIVRIVAKNTRMNKDKVAVIVDGVFKTLTEYLKDANPEVRIEIRGFGVLGIKKAKEVATLNSLEIIVGKPGVSPQMPSGNKCDEVFEGETPMDLPKQSAPHFMISNDAAHMSMRDYDGQLS